MFEKKNQKQRVKDLEQVVDNLQRQISRLEKALNDQGLATGHWREGYPSKMTGLDIDKTNIRADLKTETAERQKQIADLRAEVNRALSAILDHLGLKIVEKPASREIVKIKKGASK